ncbi:MAG: Zn-dependent membrane protease YugP [Cellvibrionaceae bacterium]|jgi:Zn-dependent membrane protease YugP
MFGSFGPYLLLMLPPLLLGLWAQFRVKRNFNKYSKIGITSGMTGAEVARQMLDAEGLYEVKVERVPGQLTDHYDPRGKVLRLSEATHDSRSVAAAGIAAHEMGHALQDAKNYGPLGLRSALVPTVQFGSQWGTWMFFGGLLLTSFLGSSLGLYIAIGGLLLYAVVALFSVVTLPVEFDASRRAKVLLVEHGILYKDEMDGVNAVLNAAALTYVAAAIQAIMQVLYWAFILFGRRR